MMKPEYLNRWTRPSHYMGAEWPEYFVFLGQNRDSDTLTRSNFASGLDAIGGEQTADDDTPLVTIVRENHWACGWIEWIAIHESATDALVDADKIMEKLGTYPAVDESHWGELEMKEANEVWKDCYGPSERVEYIRQHSSQFEFRDFRGLIACVRGRYFAGCASELLH